MTRRPPSRQPQRHTATPATATGQGASPHRGQRPQPLRSHPPALERPPQTEALRPNPLTGIGSEATRRRTLCAPSADGGAANPRPTRPTTTSVHCSAPRRPPRGGPSLASPPSGAHARRPRRGTGAGTGPVISPRRWRRQPGWRGQVDESQLIIYRRTIEQDAYLRKSRFEVSSIPRSPCAHVAAPGRPRGARRVPHSALLHNAQPSTAPPPHCVYAWTL